MKWATAGLLALAASGNAWAQDGEPSWTSISTPSGMAAAWSAKPATDPAGKPQLTIVMRTAQPGASAGTDIRASQVMAMDVDCAAGKVRPVSETMYNADFVQTGSTPVQSEWVYLAAIGELGGIARYYCMTPNPPILWQADIKTAQQKLDAAIPKPRMPLLPPQSGTFEFIGDSGVSYQPYSLWLESASIKRDGNLAKAWVLEAWTNGWAGTFSGSPATWRLYELECAERPRERNVAFQQVNTDLTPSNTMEDTEDKFSVAGDVNLKAMALRVCNNRPLLFSETIKGDVKALLSKRYVGASEKFGSGVPYASAPVLRPVDLGPTIRIVDKNAYWTYTGAFTRNGNSNSYTGNFEAEGINPLPTTLFVRGIRDGRLVIDRLGTPSGEYAIPVTNGKVSGKGVASWERANDDHSWTLVEPTMITVK